MSRKEQPEWLRLLIVGIAACAAVVALGVIVIIGADARQPSPVPHAPAPAARP